MTRAHGFDEAFARIHRARFAKALELLGGDAGDLDALVELAGPGRETGTRDDR